LSIAALLALLGLLPACLDTRTWVEKERPWNQGTVSHTEEVRVERSDGSTLTLEHPRIDHDERGDFLTGRVRTPREEAVRIDLAAIRTLEAREVDSGTVIAGLAAGIVVVAAAVLYVLYGSL
jgi:hypothetical protein